MNERGTRNTQRILCGVLVVAAVLLGGVCPVLGEEPLAGLLRGELTLQAAVSSGDTETLAKLFASPDVAGGVRGRALASLGKEWLGTGAAARARLLEALRDPAAEVRGAAARLVAETGTRPLEREVLRLVAQDPAPHTRVMALHAVRPWTRQGHLYFLEEALNSASPAVQGAALENLERLSYRELPPEVSSRVEALSQAGAHPGVRRRALAALRSWHRLSLQHAQGVAADTTAPDALRLFALRLSGTLPGTDGRDDLLVELLYSEPSLPLAWAAFQGLATEAQVTIAFEETLRGYLVRTGVRNTATEAMAAHLERSGFRVAYRSGSWQISQR